MSSGNFSITTRSDGETLTAAKYNTDRQLFVDNANPQGQGGYSDTVAQMKSTADPGEAGSESLATSTAGEFDRMRFAHAEEKGTEFWYETAPFNLSDPVGNDPVIGNSDFQLWFEGTTVPVIAASGVSTAEGWRASAPSPAAGGFDCIKDSTTVPTVAQAGVFIQSCMQINVTTADTSIAAGDVYSVSHPIEGYIFQSIAQNRFTVGFWAMSSLTGTHCVSFTNSGVDRSFVATYTISVANTWEFKVINVLASPSAGTWDYTNGLGINISWALATGSTFHTATPGTWVTGNFQATAAQVNLMATVGNKLRIGAPKTNLGTRVSRWMPPNPQKERARAGRYYLKSFNETVVPASAVGEDTAEDVWRVYAAGAVTAHHFVTFPNHMRAAPTITIFNPAAAGSQVRDETSNVNCSATSTTAYRRGFLLVTTGNAATIVNSKFGAHWTADARL